MGGFDGVLCALTAGRGRDSVPGGSRVAPTVSCAFFERASSAAANGSCAYCDRRRRPWAAPVAPGPPVFLCPVDRRTRCAIERRHQGESDQATRRAARHVVQYTSSPLTRLNGTVDACKHDERPVARRSAAREAAAPRAARARRQRAGRADPGQRLPAKRRARCRQRNCSRAAAGCTVSFDPLAMS